MSRESKFLLNMDPDVDQSKGKKKRKEPTPAKCLIPFQVFRHQNKLKLAKPYRPEWDKNVVQKLDYPNVSRERVSAANIHALHIMHNLNHRNILSIKAVGRTELQKDSNEISSFVEECEGKLNLSVFFIVAADRFQHIPSPTFQRIISEIFEGVDFLWRNETYHGNLSWETTLYQHPYTVKLHGFINKELPMVQAQWGDLDSIIVMLQDVSNEAFKQNQDPQRERKFFCGEINALIDMLRALDRNSLPLMMRDILEDVFFWTSGRRTRFIMTDVAGLLYDKEFIEEVNNSNICSLPWNNADTSSTYLDEKFEALLKHCNTYRDELPSPVANFPITKHGCVQLVYAAYTHQNQIKKTVKESVDFIVRGKFPRLFMELIRIVKAVQNLNLLPHVDSSGDMDTRE